MYVRVYIRMYVFLRGMSLCLYPLDLLQIFPLTSAGLGLTPSLCVAFQPRGILLTPYFTGQDSKQTTKSLLTPRMLCTSTRVRVQPPSTTVRRKASASDARKASP